MCIRDSYRPMFGALGAARHATRMTFLSREALERGVHQQLGLRSLIGLAHGCRTVRKGDMLHNGLMPNIEVDSQTYQVRADGELLVCEPATVLPMAQRYFLF